MIDDLEFLVRYNDSFKKYQVYNDNIEKMEYLRLVYCDKGVELNGHRYAALYKTYRKSGLTHISAVYEENGLAHHLVEIAAVPDISKILNLFNRVVVCGLRVNLYDYRGRAVPKTKSEYYFYRFCQMIGW